MQGSARKDVVFGAARVYTVTVPGSTWKSWFNGAAVFRPRKSVQNCTSKVMEVLCFNGAAVCRPQKLVVPDPAGNGSQNLAIKTHARCEPMIGNLGTPSAPPWRHPKQMGGMAFEKGTVHTDRRQSYPDSHIHFDCGLLGRTYNVAAKLEEEDASAWSEVGGG